METEECHVALMNRRRILALLAAAGTAIVAGSAFRPVQAAGSPGPSLSCVATPEQTEGPYFVDERLQRSDIRIDPADGSIKEGAPLALRLSVSSIGKSGCKPLAGAIVDIWHCDAFGTYSDVSDSGSSTAGKKFLRGYQVTDSNGTVQFTTIYPGWYPGRAVHIHFKVRTNPNAARNHELTSQLYFDDALTDRVHARMPYARRGARSVRNEQEGIFRDGGNRLLLSLVENGQGYAARFDIALQAA